MNRKEQLRKELEELEAKENAVTVDGFPIETGKTYWTADSEGMPTEVEVEEDFTFNFDHAVSAEFDAWLSYDMAYQNKEALLDALIADQRRIKEAHTEALNKAVKQLDRLLKEKNVK